MNNSTENKGSRDKKAIRVNGTEWVKRKGETAFSRHFETTAEALAWCIARGSEILDGPRFYDEAEKRVPFFFLG